MPDIGLEGLLQIIGELEVKRRVLTDANEDLTEQLDDIQKAAETKEPHAEDNVQASPN